MALQRLQFISKNEITNEDAHHTVNPLVSICVTTYQHANYIHDCISSILKQKTDFNFEVVIGEDESTDGTREICITYAQKYPQKIKLFLRERSQTVINDETGLFFRSNNGIFTMQSCTGKYIAICEGDDYWTDPNKLQMQVDYLEANPNVGLVHTDYSLVDRFGKVVIASYREYRKDKYLDRSYQNLIPNNSIGTLTIMIRSSIFHKYYEMLSSELTNWRQGDKPLWMFTSLEAKIGYIDKNTASYRKHDVSTVNTKNPRKQWSFIKSNYEISFYFLNNIKMDANLYKELLLKYNVEKLQWGFKLIQPKLAIEGLSMLIKYQPFKVTNYLYFWGSISRLNNYLIIQIIKLAKKWKSKYT